MLLRLLILCAFISIVASTSLFVGQSGDSNVRKVHQQIIEAIAIPFLKRKQEVYYEYPVGDQKIKGVAIFDLDSGLAEASINHGGVGFPFVNIKLKSQRGSGYKYLFEVYV